MNRLVATPLEWNLATVVDATGGDAHGSLLVPVHAIVTDSRSVTPDAVFVALRGEHRDGHDFAGAALEAGAAAVIVGTGRGGGLEPRIEVDDPLQALIDLAVRRRAEIDARVVAITGSTGKTSTKDLLAAGLGPDTWASPYSYNNEIGVPLTVLGTPEGCRRLVIEVGSRGLGHIARLAPAVRPHVAVITNLGLVHLETFGTPEALAAAKWELVASLGPNGVAVLPEGEERLPDHRGRCLTFGLDGGDVAVRDLVLDSDGRPAFTVHTPQGRHRMRLRLSGAHHALNAAAACAAVAGLGEDLAAACAAMESASGSPWRMEVHHGSFTIVNDAYNANPTSTESALRTVAAMPGRHMAVLGLMAELGVAEEEQHLRIGRLAAELGFNPVVVVGTDPGLAAGAGDVAVPVATMAEARAVVLEAVTPGDVVLVKGSRVVGLEALAAGLAEEASQ